MPSRSFLHLLLEFRAVPNRPHTYTGPVEKHPNALLQGPGIGLCASKQEQAFALGCVSNLSPGTKKGCCKLRNVHEGQGEGLNRNQDHGGKEISLLISILLMFYC